ncbi:MAG: rod shape-determining protein RodA [Thermoanaerobaculia bacterium]
MAEDRRELRGLAHLRWGPGIAGLLLAIIGVVTIHSAASELPGDYATRQLIWLAIALALGMVALWTETQVLVRLAPPLYGLSLALLVLVLILGTEAGGARSWIDLGPLRFQPSELARLATALLLARNLGGVHQPRIEVRHLLQTAAVVLPPMVLIALEPDLGGAAMFVPMTLGMVLVAGVRWRVMLLAVGLGVLTAAGAWNFVLLDYQKERVRTFLSPESDPLGAGYQLRQSKIAVGSGGFLGRGYMQGTQSQLRFLPARHTDFVLAVLAEEWGFVGIVSVLGLYAWYLLSGVGIASTAADRSSILLAAGLLSGFGFQVLYNVAMVVGLVPVTGIPLPFLSYGGSFLVATFLVTGVLLGIDLRRHVNR